MDDASAKLTTECNLLGVNPKALKILNWNIGYNGMIQAAQSAIYNNYSNSTFMNGAQGVTGPQGVRGFTGIESNSYPTAQKLGSIYQELLDYKPLEPGFVVVSVPVQVNYVWNE
jgi:hypothetical protein